MGSVTARSERHRSSAPHARSAVACGSAQPTRTSVAPRGTSRSRAGRRTASASASATGPASGARLLAAHGRRARAEVWLDEAGELADETGAVRVREQVEAVARRLAPAGAGTTAPKPARADLTSLTARERQITDILTTGARTKEIAGALFLSPRTVESHIARIYRKLGVTSRLARVAALAPPPSAPRADTSAVASGRP
ncbi:response regulator transcription factor [Kitasatospora sp. NPDC057223]|uniref:helix-turn-helix transcriptional regulator n=1 Tax=Kitasatospora sp. NPDC057223 TaxID=3346055 RepID=UPI0036320613